MGSAAFFVVVHLPRLYVCAYVRVFVQPYLACVCVWQPHLYFGGLRTQNRFRCLIGDGAVTCRQASGPKNSQRAGERELL